MSKQDNELCQHSFAKHDRHAENGSDTHIQDIALGPPEASAVATPTRLPAPTSLPMAEQSAPKALTPLLLTLAVCRL